MAVDSHDPKINDDALGAAVDEALEGMSLDAKPASDVLNAFKENVSSLVEAFSEAAFIPSDEQSHSINTNLDLEINHEDSGHNFGKDDIFTGMSAEAQMARLRAESSGSGDFNIAEKQGGQDSEKAKREKREAAATNDLILQQIAEIDARIAALEAEREEILGKLKDAESRLEIAEADLENAGANLKIAEQNYEDAADAQKLAEGNLEATNAQIILLEDKEEEFESRVNNGGGIEDKRELERIRDDLGRLRNQRDGQREERDHCQKETRKALKDLKDTRDEYNEAKGKVEHIKTTEVDPLREQLYSIDAQLEIERQNKAEIAELLAERERVAAKLEKLTGEGSTYHSLLEEANTLRSEYDTKVDNFVTHHSDTLTSFIEQEDTINEQVKAMEPPPSLSLGPASTAFSLLYFLQSNPELVDDLKTKQAELAEEMQQAADDVPLVYKPDVLEQKQQEAMSEVYENATGITLEQQAEIDQRVSQLPMILSPEALEQEKQRIIAEVTGQTNDSTEETVVADSNDTQTDLEAPAPSPDEGLQAITDSKNAIASAISGRSITESELQAIAKEYDIPESHFDTLKDTLTEMEGVTITPDLGDAPEPTHFASSMPSDEIREGSQIADAFNTAAAPAQPEPQPAPQEPKPEEPAQTTTPGVMA